jgi:hypothetical protein
MKGSGRDVHLEHPVNEVELQLSGLKFGEDVKTTLERLQRYARGRVPEPDRLVCGCRRDQLAVR